MPDTARGAGDEGDLSVKFHRGGLSLCEIIENDLAESQGEVGDDVGGGYDLEDRQVGGGRSVDMRHDFRFSEDDLEPREISPLPRSRAPYA